VYYPLAMSTLKSILVFALISYGALLALMYFAQRALMYFPDTARTLPAAVGLAQAAEEILDTADGEKVIVWHVPPRGDKPVALYFHGNGGALGLRAGKFSAIVADGTGLIALSYRGYGGSSGRPSEAGLIADAEASYAFAAARYPPERIVLWGESLGTGVAIALAIEHPVGKLVLEAPFTSAVDIAAAIYPFMPVRLLMKDQFRSDQRIGQVKAPVLVLHGARDRIIPIAFGERLYALVRSPKRFVRFADGGHEDLEAHGALAAAKNFIEGKID
jgi:fermentation-respiration switch protein FrsA (DUF1100 family)